MEGLKDTDKIQFLLTGPPTYRVGHTDLARHDLGLVPGVVTGGRSGPGTPRPRPEGGDPTQHSRTRTTFSDVSTTHWDSPYTHRPDMRNGPSWTRVDPVSETPPSFRLWTLRTKEVCGSFGSQRRRDSTTVVGIYQQLKLYSLPRLIGSRHPSKLLRSGTRKFIQGRSCFCCFLGTPTTADTHPILCGSNTPRRGPQGGRKGWRGYLWSTRSGSEQDQSGSSTPDTRA